MYNKTREHLWVVDIQQNKKTFNFDYNNESKLLVLNKY